MIGRREQGEGVARNAEDTMKTITQRVGTIPPDRRPRVYYARGPRGLETGLGGSINVETIEFVAQNVAGGTRGGLANVSIEQVLLWNPDVIITIDQDSRRMFRAIRPGRRLPPCARTGCISPRSCRSVGSIFPRR